MSEEDIQTSPIEEAVDKVEPDFGAVKKPDGLSILQVPDKLEDISNDLLSRFDYFFSWHNRCALTILKILLDN